MLSLRRSDREELPALKFCRVVALSALFHPHPKIVISIEATHIYVSGAAEKSASLPHIDLLCKPRAPPLTQNSSNHLKCSGRKNLIVPFTPATKFIHPGKAKPSSVPN
jgi:hypothetical protein